MKTLLHLVGGSTKEEKADRAAQDQALQTQQRAANSAQEDAAVTRAESAASGRVNRTGGRRTLAFMGSELGVTDSLAATGA